MKKLQLLNSIKKFVLKEKAYDEFKKLTKNECSDYSKLQEEIYSTNYQIRSAYNNFNFVTDKDSISYYAYLIKALEMKYALLLKQVKKAEDT